MVEYEFFVGCFDEYPEKLKEHLVDDFEDRNSDVTIRFVEVRSKREAHATVVYVDYYNDSIYADSFKQLKEQMKKAMLRYNMLSNSCELKNL